jgi:2-methylcitrate dehydratase
VSAAGFTWAGRLATAAHDWFLEATPGPVLERAAIHTFDTIGCAASANDSAAVEAVRRTIVGSGPPVASVWFTGQRASPGDAVLANGTAVRFLDANDVILGSGPGGHPSDNIPVALAAAEMSGASGRDMLTAVAIGYELVARIRTHLFRPSLRGPDWHEVSISGPVSAMMTALLLGADVAQLTNALTISASRGYTLKEVRRGQISLLKATANAGVAREGVLAAMLAMNGLTGPPEVFEGGSGLLKTLGAPEDLSALDALCALPDWMIHDVSIKPYPAFGTSQAAISAAVAISDEVGGIDPSEVETITIRLPDTPWTRDYVTLRERRVPTTRGTADHSIQFLVAAALIDGAIMPSHYEEERWLDSGVQALMIRTEIVPDEDLADLAVRAFPAAVEVRLAGGRNITHVVTNPPGSPGSPWGWEEVSEKFRMLDRAALGADRIGRIAAAARDLEDSANVERLIETIH